MKSLQFGLLATLFFLVGCATTVGTWQGTASNTDATALRADVEKSLVAEQWLTYPDVAGLKAVKAGPGGQRTWALFTFSGGAVGANGSTFTLVGKSDHVVNWLSFGILGLSLQTKARQVCTDWYESWQHAHPIRG